MNQKLALSLLVLATLFAGCTTTQLTIAPVPTEIAGDKPNAYVLEQTHRVSVQLLTPTFSRKLSELPTFQIDVENRGDESIILSTYSVKLTSGAQAVPAYTLQEYAKRLQEANQREADEYSGRQAEVALQNNGSLSNPSINDNSQAIAKITAAKQTNRAAAERNYRTQLQDEANELIDIHQINPGQRKIGKIKFHGEQIQARQPLQLVVTLNGEPYAFTFQVTEKTN